MRRERGPRLDMELVHGSGKGVGEEERAGGEGGPSQRKMPVKVHARGDFLEWTSGILVGNPGPGKSAPWRGGLGPRWGAVGVSWALPKVGEP